MPSRYRNENRPLQRPPFDAVATELVTAKGLLSLRGPVSPDRLTGYRLAEGLSCFRPARQQHRALISLAQEPDGLTFTATLEDTIIGYAAFQRSDFPWWRQRSFPELLELSALETDPAWRGIGLASSLLRAVFDNPRFSFFETAVVFTILTVSNWDLRGTGLDPWAYRRLMMHLFEQFGFTPRETKDPEIREHPCNTLLARVGTQAPAGTEQRFAACCMTNQESEVGNQNDKTKTSGNRE